METDNKTEITVETTIKSPVEKVWNFFTGPQHITQWNNASDDWHTPYAENDLRVNGKFKYTMAARDGSMRFDFEGTYTAVKKNEQIDYSLADGRKVSVKFSILGDETTVTETFDAENTNTPDVQREGWQAILNNFNIYVEAKK